jgi:hypothetical protein
MIFSALDGKKTALSGKKIQLVLLLLTTVLLRLVPIFPNKFAFMYDHAKDALIILQMGTTFKPALVGAVTSIPGVYYGPLWYYLALPLNVLMNYWPLASVLTVILLSAWNVWLAWKYLGKFEAFLLCVSAGLIGTQTSAWSPYLTPLVVLPVIIILNELVGLKKSNNANLKSKPSHKIKLLNLKTKLSSYKIKLLAILALTTALSFHFQPAFGVVLVFLNLVSLLLFKIKLNLKQVVGGLLIFALPFIPQVIFEFRHDFIQSKQLLSFIQNYSHQAEVISPNQAGFARVTEVGQYMFKVATGAILPIDLSIFSLGVKSFLIAVMAVGVIVWLSYLFVYSLINAKSRHLLLSPKILLTRVLLKLLKGLRWSSWSPLLKITAIFILGTNLAYLFLPVKPYYLVALIPVFVVGFAQLIKEYFQSYQKKIVIVFLLLAGINFFLMINKNNHLATTRQFMLAPKLATIEKIYQLSQGNNFTSYQFLPEVYDYPYQFLFIRSVLNGKDQPLEFSYKPGEYLYLEQVAPKLAKQYHKKDSALGKFSNIKGGSQPQYIFLITHQADYPWVYNLWWQEVAGQFEIVDQYQINKAITLYRALPRGQAKQDQIIVE